MQVFFEYSRKKRYIWTVKRILPVKVGICVQKNRNPGSNFSNCYGWVTCLCEFDMTNFGTNNPVCDTVWGAVSRLFVSDWSQVLNTWVFLGFCLKRLNYWNGFAIDKVRIFREGHKIWKNIPLKIWRYWRRTLLLKII